MAPKGHLNKRDRQELILAVFRQPKKLKELCGRYGIAVSTLYKWRNRFLHSGLEALDDHKRGTKGLVKPTEREAELQKKLKEAEERIALISTEFETFKKNDSWS